MNAIKFKKAFLDHASPWHLYRSTYKFTDCGPTIGMCIDGKNLYCSDLPDRWEGDISTIFISSIVEGVEETTDTIEIIIANDDSPKQISGRYWRGVEIVDDQAKTIWNQTHGCENCLYLHTGTRHIEPFEYIPVHPDCKECEGTGVII